MAVDKKTQQTNEMGPEFMRNLADNAKRNLIRDFVEEHIKPAATSGKYFAIIELYDTDDEDEVNTRVMIEDELEKMGYNIDLRIETSIQDEMCSDDNEYYTKVSW